MAANRTTFEKLQRDRAKKAKAAAKRARRLGRDKPQAEKSSSTTSPVDAEWTIGDSDAPLSAAELLAAVEQLQAQFDAKTITEEEFEERKIDLLARVSTD